MATLILPEEPSGDNDNEDYQNYQDRLQRIEQDLWQLREAGIDVDITPAQLIALEDQGYMYDFENRRVLVTQERFSLN